MRNKKLWTLLRKMSNKIIYERRSKENKRITKYEDKIISSGKCPNCKISPLYEGPSGGLSQNIRCYTCGQGYNISPFGIENIGIDEYYILKNKRFYLNGKSKSKNSII